MNTQIFINLIIFTKLTKIIKFGDKKITATINLKNEIGDILDSIRKKNHPLASLNKFGNFIIAEYILNTFNDSLTKEQRKVLREVVKE